MSQEYKVEMVLDPYQVEILGISILVKQRENCQTKGKFVFLDELKWEKELLKHRSPSLSREIKHFGDAL